jgi:hypothetical protein
MTFFSASYYQRGYMMNLQMDTTDTIVYLLAFTGLYLWLFRQKRRPVQTIRYARRPTIGKPDSLTADEKELLGVAPTRRPRRTAVKLAKVGFPYSPIMPDIQVVDGIAPYNPEIVGNEWGSALVKDQVGATHRARAFTVPVVAQTPTPKMVPLPTMIPSPGDVTVAKLEPYDGNTNQSMVHLPKPLDATMSKWTQFGPHSIKYGARQRTRTCIHDGIDGGKRCGHTLEVSK